MTTNQHHDATERQSKVLPGRAFTASARGTHQQTPTYVECGSGWYHEAAIKQSDKAGPRK